MGKRERGRMIRLGLSLDLGSGSCIRNCQRVENRCCNDSTRRDRRTGENPITIALHSKHQVVSDPVSM
jgi:hypothetical protein